MHIINEGPRARRGRARAAEPKTTLHIVLTVDMMRALDEVTDNRTQFVNDLLMSDPDMFDAWSRIKLQQETDPNSENVQIYMAMRASRLPDQPPLTWEELHGGGRPTPIRQSSDSGNPTDSEPHYTFDPDGVDVSGNAPNW